MAAFLGIPYAEKPIGQNRFLPPKPVAVWSQPLEATKVGSVCAQLPANGLIRMPVLPGSDDCLLAALHLHFMLVYTLWLCVHVVLYASVGVLLHRCALRGTVQMAAANSGH